MRQFNVTTEELERQDSAGLTDIIDAAVERNMPTTDMVQAIPGVFPRAWSEYETDEWTQQFMSDFRQSRLFAAYDSSCRDTVEAYETELSLSETGTCPDDVWLPVLPTETMTEADEIVAVPQDLAVVTGGLARAVFAQQTDMFENYQDHGYDSLLQMAQHVSAALVLRAELQGRLFVYPTLAYEAPLANSLPKTRHNLGVGFAGSNDPYLFIQERRIQAGQALTPALEETVRFSPISVNKQVNLDDTLAPAAGVARNCMAFMDYAGISYSQQKRTVSEAIGRAHAMTGEQFSGPLFGEVFNVTDNELSDQIQDLLDDKLFAPVSGDPRYGDGDVSLMQSSWFQSMAAMYDQNQTVISFSNRSDQGHRMLLQQGLRRPMVKGKDGFTPHTTLSLCVEDMPALLAGLIVANQTTSTATHPNVLTGLIERAYNVTMPANNRRFDS